MINLVSNINIWILKLDIFSFYSNFRSPTYKFYFSRMKMVDVRTCVFWLMELTQLNAAAHRD